MLNKLRKKAMKLSKDTNEDKYSKIVELLNDENAFNKMEVNSAIAILLDLGYDSHEAMKIYIEFFPKTSKHSLIKLSLLIHDDLRN